MTYHQERRHSSTPPGTLPPLPSPQHPPDRQPFEPWEQLWLQGWRSEYSGEDTVSVFIFSDSEKKQLTAVKELAERVIEILGQPDWGWGRGRGVRGRRKEERHGGRDGRSVGAEGRAADPPLAEGGTWTPSFSVFFPYDPSLPNVPTLM